MDDAGFVRFSIGRPRPYIANVVKSVAEGFARDSLTAVLRVLEQASEALTATEIKDVLRAGGVAKADTDHAWPRVQRALMSHVNVAASSAGHPMTYRWMEQPADPSAIEALNLLATGYPRAPRRLELVGIVRTALAQHVVARLEQKEKDAVRALAEMAIEVEELATNEASSRAVIHRIRARTKLSGLEPIGRIGETTPYDRRRHESISQDVEDGSPVVVVRPGYVWKRPHGDLLVVKAVVQDRS